MQSRPAVALYSTFCFRAISRYKLQLTSIKLISSTKNHFRIVYKRAAIERIHFIIRFDQIRLPVE